MGRMLSVVGLGLAAGASVHWPTLPARAETGSVFVAAANSGRETSKPISGRRSWNVGEFSTLRLVSRETGAAPNEHPARLDAQTLRQLLAQLRTDIREGAQSLFADGEVAELAEPLAQALANASADDDVLLLSTSRRGGGLLAKPLAVTARLFVQGGSLNFIVNDTRFEFYDRFRATGTAPEFTFGSRRSVGAGVLVVVPGAARRTDWAALPLAAKPGVVPVAADGPPAVAGTAAPPPALAPEAAAAGGVRARGPQFTDEIEQRLLTLKHLRDKGLISEEEYQNKRREILRLL